MTKRVEKEKGICYDCLKTYTENSQLTEEKQSKKTPPIFRRKC